MERSLPQRRLHRHHARSPAPSRRGHRHRRIQLPRARERAGGNSPTKEEEMSLPHPEASYVASVVTLYLEMPDTPMRVSASDQWLARHFHQDSVSLETIETAQIGRASCRERVQIS